MHIQVTELGEPGVIMISKFYAFTIFSSLHEVAVGEHLIPLLWTLYQMANKAYRLSETLFSVETSNIPKRGSWLGCRFRVLETFVNTSWQLISTVL